MNNIQIFDNFLDENEINNCNEIIKTVKWVFGHDSGSTNEINTPFWYSNLIHNDFLKTEILLKIEKITGKKFKINRLYVNGQTYGQNGCFHQDDVTLNTYTFCLYFSGIPHEIIDTVGGFIQFKIPDIQKYIIDIEPLFNRGILFPSYYYHRGLSFSRYVNELRICIAWKLEEL